MQILLKPKKSIYFVSFIVLITLSIIFTVITWQKKIPLVSPISLIENNYLPQLHKNKVVYGFLPYWNLKYLNNLQINHLTHLAYFSISLNDDGTVVKKSNPKELEPGWNKLNSNETQQLLYQSKILRQKTIITITAMEPDLIESIVNSQQNTNNAINGILDTYHKFKFDGINIDFEYVGTPSQVTIDNFTSFIKNLKSECQKVSPNCFIDIDVFGDSSEKTRIWDIEKTYQVVDHFIIMAYDYYRKTSTKAGPIAPLTGSCQKTPSNQECLETDILTNLNHFLKKIPPEKIVLGVPFYGYEWQTASEDFLSNTYPRTGSLATYQRIQDLIRNPNTSSLSAKWSNDTLSPYLIYYDNEKIKQIHFEDQQSLKEKTNIIKALNLNGVAIWALGYEVPYQELWKTIDTLNN